MPLMFELQMDAEHISTVTQVLANVTGAAPEHCPTGQRLRCPREQKMAVLASLATLSACVHDLKMLEPSLEDVFFGFAD